MKHRLTLSFTVVVEPDEERFHAYAPAFKGLHVDGKTEKEALRFAVEAVGVYLKSLARTETHCLWVQTLASRGR